MEFQKIVNFLDTTSDLLKFVIKKWVEDYDQSQENYDVNIELELKNQC